MKHSPSLKNKDKKKSSSNNDRKSRGFKDDLSRYDNLEYYKYYDEDDDIHDEDDDYEDEEDYRNYLDEDPN